MKTFISTTIAFLAVLIFLSSCSTTNDVASNSSIVKRKYRKGYYVELPKLFNKHPHTLAALPKEENVKKHVDNNEEMQFMASVESSIPLVDNIITITNIKPDSKLFGTIKRVQHLYDSDINGFLTFRTEYKKIKTDFRRPLTVAEKGGDDPRYSLSILSFASSVIGFFIAGIILGVLAIILGTIALAKKKKGRVLAIVGIVLGIADIILVLIYLSTL